MKIAIRGHESRGKEVIQILENLGGINRMNHSGSHTNYFYYISNDDNTIGWTGIRTGYLNAYTLEKFEKEFPFKIGDEVTITGLPDFPKVITQMVWDCGEILYSFEGLNNTWFGAKSLKKIEMKEERNITLTLDKAKEWYNKGGELKEIALQAFTEKELNPLPKSWKEFCTRHNTIKDDEYYIDVDSNLLRVNDMISNHNRLEIADRNIYPSKKSAEAHLAMIQLEQLRNCWRQGWGPDWNDEKQTKYCINYFQGKFKISILYETRCFLSFPTIEMAEEFLECFKNLIEQAGDLI